MNLREGLTFTPVFRMKPPRDRKIKAIMTNGVIHYGEFMSIIWFDDILNKWVNKYEITFDNDRIVAWKEIDDD